jgi:CubicO group peptidase (beta-lactamase class C family)
MKILIQLIVFIALTLNLFSQDINTESDIDVFIEGQANRYHIPGIAVAVLKGKDIVFKKGYGWADLENKVPMSTTGVMNIASISKTITATAAMQLVEAGMLDLNTDINQYLDFKIRNPNHPETSITLKQILTHTSSINDGPNYRLGYECGDPNVSLEEWIKSYLSVQGKWYDAEDNFLKKAPDSVYQYSNVAFGLLGYIVEIVSGRPFHQYVKDKIFDPLEMHQSGYYLTDIDTDNLITPYMYLGPLQRNLSDQSDLPLKHYNPYCRYSFWNYPDGLVRTSVEDLAHLAIAYMNAGKYKYHQLLSPQTIEMMHQPQLPVSLDEDGFQGLSWFHSSGLDPSWFHGGSDPGVSTRLYIDKENDLSVIVFQNANEDNSYYIARMLYNYFKGK